MIVPGGKIKTDAIPFLHNLRKKVIKYGVPGILVSPEFDEFLGVPLDRIPTDTDTITDPKQFLVSLARRSRLRRLRQDLVPEAGSTSIQGPDYNGRLSGFIESQWNVHQARRHSESLDRAFVRLRKFQLG